MALMRRNWILFLSLALQGVAFAQLHEVGDGSFGPVKAHVTAELKTNSPAQSGNSNIALVLQLEAGWNVYWVNPGTPGNRQPSSGKFPQRSRFGSTHGLSQPGI